MLKWFSWWNCMFGTQETETQVELSSPWLIRDYFVNFSWGYPEQIMASLVYFRGRILLTFSYLSGQNGKWWWKSVLLIRTILEVEPVWLRTNIACRISGHHVFFLDPLFQGRIWVSVCNNREYDGPVHYPPSEARFYLCFSFPFKLSSPGSLFSSFLKKFGFFPPCVSVIFYCWLSLETHG